MKTKFCFFTSIKTFNECICHAADRLHSFLLQVICLCARYVVIKFMCIVSSTQHFFFSSYSLFFVLFSFSLFVF